MMDSRCQFTYGATKSNDCVGLCLLRASSMRTWTSSMRSPSPATVWKTSCSRYTSSVRERIFSIMDEGAHEEQEEHKAHFPELCQ